jgi:hypothetical protein
MTAVAGSVRRGRDLVDDTLFDRVATKVATERSDLADRAERIVDQALAFVATAAEYPGRSLAPSPQVDEGWHQLILHTEAYADLCNRLGRFVHHVPDDTLSTLLPDSASSGSVARTINAIEQAGFVVDSELWLQMGDCYEESKCSASGENGNENSDTRIPPPVAMETR